MTEDNVRRVNRLTTDWVATLAPDSSLVLSGAGAWVLLAAIASGAHGAARTELENSAGVSGDEAPAAVNWILDLLGASDGLSAAFGIWAAASVEIRSEFAEAIPLLTVGPIPEDLTVLDSWVERGTNGILTAFPGVVTPESLLVAATALCAQADWLDPFEEGSGRWRSGGDWVGWLSRRTGELSSAAVLRSSTCDVGRVVCSTEGSFDVHLLTGDESLGPDQVVSLGIDALASDSGVDLEPGPSLGLGETVGCLSVQDLASEAEELRLSLPAFEITSDWNLTASPTLFGLSAAMDASVGHFDRISTFPLAVENASQVATAGFSAHGFRAAAVSSMMWMAGGGPPKTISKVISVQLDRPFGFLVVHRTSGLVLFAGWIAEPGVERNSES